MKTNNRFPARIAAFVLSLVMLFTFSIPALAVNVEIAETKYYTIDYDSDTGTPRIILTLNAEELGKMVEDRNFTKEELKKFLPDFLTDALEGGKRPSLQNILDFLPPEMLDYDELIKIIPEDVFEYLLRPELFVDIVTEDFLEETFTDTVIDHLLTAEAVDKLFTKEISDKLLTAEVLDKMLDDRETVKTLLEDESVVKSLLEDEAIVNKLLEDREIVKALLKDTETVKSLLNDEVFASFVSTPEEIKSFYGTGILDKEEVKALLSEEELAEVAVAADPEATALQFAIANHTNDLVELLKEDPDGVIDFVGVDKIIDTVGTDAIIDKVGIESIITEVGLDRIIDVVGLKKIVDAVGIHKILDAVGAPKIVDAIGLNNMISTVGVEKIVEAVEVGRIIKYVGFDKIILAIQKSDSVSLLDTVKSMLSQMILNKVNSLDITTESNGTTLSANVLEFSNTDLCFELKLNELIDIIAKSLPTLETLQSMEDGDIIYDISFKTAFEGTEALGAFGITVKVAGDTTLINKYAAKLFSVLDYKVNDDASLELNIDDSAADAPIKFAELFTKAIETGRFNEAEKAKLFSIFDKTGEELITALENLNLDRLEEFIDAGYIPYITKLRDESVRIFKAVMNRLPEKYSNLSINSLYQGNGQFVFSESLSLESSKLVNKLISIIGISEEDFNAVFKYDESIGGSVSINVQMSDVYRISYCTDDGEVLYSTYLPVGADISLISDNTAILEDLAPNGWKDQNGKTVKVMPAEDLNLYTSRPDIYRVTFMANGKVIRVVPFVAGDTELPELPRVPSVIGYTGEWEDFELGNADITVNAIYTANEYKISFDANGGTGSMDSVTATYDSELTLPANTFVREGFEFKGWNAKPDGSGRFFTDEKTVKNLATEGELTLYAQWNVVYPEFYRATFVANGRTVGVVVFLEGDTELHGIPEVPAILGYSGEWESYTLGNADITINAIYTANSYKVSFDANGGEGAMETLDALYGEELIIPENGFVREGYEFKYWSTKANGLGTRYDELETVKNLVSEGELTLYAQWSLIPLESHTVTFMVFGKVIDVVIYFEDETELYRAPEVPTLEGHTGKWEKFTLNGSDIVVNAIYTPNDYKINFNANGGEGTMAAIDAEYAADITLPANTFTRTDCEFVGWNTKADGSGYTYADKASVKDLATEGEVTLYAMWSTDSTYYTATFKADGKVIGLIRFFKGETTLSGVPEVPVKAGYTGAWASYTLGASDITVEAVYSPNSYKINFNANGGEGTMAALDAKYATVIKLPANAFTRAGYEFVGWNTAADGSGIGYSDVSEVISLATDGEVTLYARWNVLPDEHLTATFMADGKIVGTVGFVKGDTTLTNVPAVPAKRGYTGAWEAYTLGETDITVNVKYTANSYKVNFDANGGTGTMDALNATFDAELALSANSFERDGFKFIGWNTAANGTGIAYADGESIKNLAAEGETTLYAQWSALPAKELIATFMADGRVVGTVPFFAGATELSAAPAVPVKAGYTGAWESYTLGDADITINAVYTANSYKVIFNANGGEGSLSELAATYGAVINLPANVFVRDGYEFKGWNTAADGSGKTYLDGASVKDLTADGEITLYAQWEETPANWTLITIIASVVVIIAATVIVLVVIKRDEKKDAQNDEKKNDK